MPSSNSALRLLKKGWDALQAGLMWFGERISDLLFTVLYFTMFAIVAIPYRLMMRSTVTGTNYRKPEAGFTREQFSDEW